MDARRSSNLTLRWKKKEAIKLTIWNTAYSFVLVANSLYFLSFYVILPTLPLYLLSFGGDGSLSGMIVSLVIWTAFIVRPVASYYLDRGGRVSVLFGGLIAMLLGCFGFLLLPSDIFLIPSFLLGGGFGIATTASGTIMADSLPPERMGEGIGYYGMGISIAMALGPVVGLRLAEEGNYILLFVLPGLFVLFAFALAGALAKVLQGKGVEKTGSSGVAEIPVATTTTERSQSSYHAAMPAVPPALTLFCLTLTYGAFLGYLSLYGLDVGISNVSPFFLAFSLVVMVGRPLAGRSSDRLDRLSLVLGGMMLATVSTMLVGFTSSLTAWILLAVFYGVGFSFAQTSLQSLCFILVGQERRGAASAIYYMAFDFGIGAGPVLLGFLAAGLKFSFRGMFVTAGLVCLGGFLYFLVRRRQMQQKLLLQTSP